MTAAFRIGAGATATGFSFGFGMALIIDTGEWQQPLGVVLVAAAVTALTHWLLQVHWMLVGLLASEKRTL